MRPSEVILESRTRSALAWSIEINRTRCREMRQMAEVGTSVFSFIKEFALNPIKGQGD